MSANATLFEVALSGAYPQREIPRENWLDQFGRRCLGSVKRRLEGRSKGFARVVAGVNAHAEEIAGCSDGELARRVDGIRGRLRERGLEDVLVFECFALIRETAARTLGRRHFDVQVYGGWVLLRGYVAEMDTGEGKTLTATLAAACAALAGIPTHVITVNDYLVERDAADLGPLYSALGLSVGTIVEGMSPDQRRAAYACDVTYCTNKELVFDYLKDRLTLARQASPIRLQLERVYGRAGGNARLLMRGLHYAIIDEADSVLIDESRVPVIISRTVDNPEQHAFYREAMALAASLARDRDYLIDPEERRARLTEAGREAISAFAADRGGTWRWRNWREEGMLQAIVARELYVRDQHYLVADDKVQIIDEFTGRTMPDRSWEQGLHQLIEAKEGVTLTGQREPLAKISYQVFFRRYLRLAGMSGTVKEVAPELWNVYRLHTVRVPTHRPCVRRAQADRVYLTSERKWQAVVERVGRLYEQGRPVLIGTRSVATSDALSRRLSAAGLEHQVLNARQDAAEAQIVALAGGMRTLTVATNMAGRGTDIAPSPEALAAGGLHVIATERHEAGRIDRQLFGRAGRQGDPGSCECLLSLEDELIAEHASRVVRHLAWILARPTGEVPRWCSRLLFHLTQRRIERRHARVRRDLLDMDQRRGDMLAFAGRQE